MITKTSQKGINLIKRFEGFRAKAYKAVPTEKYYTIGYGHYGKDVAKDGIVDEEEAEYLLKIDLQSAERAVMSTPLAKQYNQNQFDALVSFTYNCGSGNLATLVCNRPMNVIGEKIVLYNKAGGKVLNGLVRRRREEQKLFFS